MNSAELVLRLFVQLAVLLLACRLVGAWLRRLAQPLVVAEMVTGVLLGPSLFGLLAPETHALLFPRTLAAGGPHPSMTILLALGQLGACLYMFLVGLEFAPRLVMSRKRGAGLVSLIGIALPFSLGAAIAPWFAARGGLFAPGVATLDAAIFLGACMAITAFPMLARILYERGIIQTELGALTLAAGAINDAVAWCLLAIVTAGARGAYASGLLVLVAAVAFCLLVATLGRHVLARSWAGTDSRFPELSKLAFATTLIVLLIGAGLADWIGVHAVFGAFLVGLAMPRGPSTETIRARIQPLTEGLLLPVFFVYSGLNTRLGLLDSLSLWGIAALVLILATLGKGLGCMLAARASGMEWRTSAAVGALMNARGLMELLILNIGLQLGLITETLFTIMVMMAIVTTVLASPLFSLFQRTPAAPSSPDAPASGTASAPASGTTSATASVPRDGAVLRGSTGA